MRTFDRPMSGGVVGVLVGDRGDRSVELDSSRPAAIGMHRAELVEHEGLLRCVRPGAGATRSAAEAARDHYHDDHDDRREDDEAGRGERTVEHRLHQPLVRGPLRVPRIAGAIAAPVAFRPGSTSPLISHSSDDCPTLAPKTPRTSVRGLPCRLRESAKHPCRPSTLTVVPRTGQHDRNRPSGPFTKQLIPRNTRTDLARCGVPYLGEIETSAYSLSHEVSLASDT